MKHAWLNKSGNSELIILFAGWSFDENPFRFLEPKDADVLVFYDYTEINFDIDLSGYKKYYLLAWSMGVYVALLLRNKLPNFEKKIALNGTPMPVDNMYGIPIRTFELTLKYAEEGLKGKFYQNVFYEEHLLEKYLQTPVSRSIENRVSELNALKSRITAETADAGSFYDLAYVSLYDKIIPPKNQFNVWNTLKVPVISLPGGHFPFYNFHDWKEICK